MTGLLTIWILVLVTFQDVSGCFNDAGEFVCAQKWYFWVSLFAGFLVLFVIVFCVNNHCCKKTTNGLETPRILSAIQRQKNRGCVRPISNTSQWYPDTTPTNETQRTVPSANGTQIHVSQAWQQPAVANQTAPSSVQTIYPNSTSVFINQSYF